MLPLLPKLTGKKTTSKSQNHTRRTRPFLNISVRQFLSVTRGTRLVHPVGVHESRGGRGSRPTLALVRT